MDTSVIWLKSKWLGFVSEGITEKPGIVEPQKNENLV